MSRRKWLILTALAMEEKAIAAELGVVLGKWDLSVRVIGIRGGRFDRTGLDQFENVILAGLAGALDPSLAIGDVVCDGAGEKGLPDTLVRRGKIYTAEKLISTAEEKARLFKETGCLAVDMEGSVVRAALDPLGIPFLHIRAISDLASQDVSERMLNWVDDVGNARPGRVAADLIAHPTLVPGMIRLGRQSNIAVRRMADIVRQVVQSPAGF